MRGLLVAIEGIDRAGKSTQVEYLKKTHNFEVIKFPNVKTATGRLIYEVLKGKQKMNETALHLLFSANRWETINEIEYNLNNYHNVVLDRYYLSGIAYAQVNGISMCKTLYADSELPKPDVTIYMDLLPDIASQREEYGEQITENLEFQQKVYQKYKQIICNSTNHNIEIIDANKGIENINNEISNIIKKNEKYKTTSLSYLTLQDNLL